MKTRSSKRMRRGSGTGDAHLAKNGLNRIRHETGLLNRLGEGPRNLLAHTGARISGLDEGPGVTLNYLQTG